MTNKRSNTLVLVRSYMHIPYIYRLINTISKSEDVIILVDKRWAKNSLRVVRNSSLLLHDNIKSIESSVAPNFLNKFSLQLKELYTYIYYLDRFGVDSFYTKRWFSYLHSYLKILAVATKNSFIINKLIKSIIKYMAPTLFNNQVVKKQLKSMDIHHVICTSINLRFSIEEFYLATANSLGIPVYYNVLTWDNLSTKGTFLNKPTMIFSWNEKQKQQLLRYHKCEDVKIGVVGSLYFEKWINIKEQLHSTVALTEKNFSYVLYLGSSANIIGDESNIIQSLSIIIDRINNNNNNNMLKLLFKSHPAKPLLVNEYFNCEEWNEFGLCEDKNNELEFAKLLSSASCIFGVNTSAMIDASFVSNNVYSLTHTMKSRQINILHFEEMCELFNIKKINFNRMQEIEDAICKTITNSNSRITGTITSDILQQTSHLIWSKICEKNIG